MSARSDDAPGAGQGEAVEGSLHAGRAGTDLTQAGAKDADGLVEKQRRPVRARDPHQPSLSLSEVVLGLLERTLGAVTDLLRRAHQAQRGGLGLLRVAQPLSGGIADRTSILLVLGHRMLLVDRFNHRCDVRTTNPAGDYLRLRCTDSDAPVPPAASPQVWHVGVGIGATTCGAGLWALFELWSGS